MTPGREPKPFVRKDGTISLDRRGYSWPPFENGNLVALRHGAQSSRIVEQVAAGLAPELDRHICEQAPWAEGERHVLTRRNLAETLAVKVLMLRSIAKTVEKEGVEHVPTRRFEVALSALRAERDALEALGMSPRGEAELRAIIADTAVTEHSLADLAAEGRAVRERRELEAKS